MEGKRAACKRHQRGGFGLVELIVSLTIGMIVILGVGLTQTATAELNRTSDETHQAVSDLRTVLEEILSQPLEDIPDPDGLYAPGVPVAAYTDLHLAGQRLVVTYPNHVAGSTVPDPLEILVTLSWNDFRGRPRSVSMSTLTTR